MPSAVELSAYVALVAVGLLAANLALGLLMAAGFNPARHWPHRQVKALPVSQIDGEKVYVEICAAVFALVSVWRIRHRRARRRAGLVRV